MMTSNALPRNIVRLGTRKSLLAWAQSGWVAREIERLNPGLKVEMVGIETRGDKILDISLRNVEGKEFFVAELDHALRDGQVDFTVHSMKDLSLDRPAEFTLGAIPRRANCRDVILFSPRVREKLAAGGALKIGTSSPRRIENIPPFLEKALPLLRDQKPSLDFVEIRGNVNTRLSRVHEPKDSPKHLDGVVLAFAGLIRLWADPTGRAELQKLLQGLRWMVLPVRENPTAPAQGALAVECRKDDTFVREALGKLHDPETATHVARERAVLSEWGGGCHQKFGATSMPSDSLGHLLFIRGKKPDETFIQDLQWEAPAKPAGEIRGWDGQTWRSKVSAEERLSNQDSMKPAFERAVFVAHSRAVHSDWTPSLTHSRVWTSGPQSWFKLAEQGIWIEGCAEGMGFDFLASTLKEAVLQLPEAWTVLTHEKAGEGWESQPSVQVIATYRLASSTEQGTPSNATLALQKATHVFWSSGSQFDAMTQVMAKELKSGLPHNAHHSCGPGKTAAYLKTQGLNPQIFPSVEEWRKWLSQTQ